MELDFLAIQQILQGSNGMTAKEILRELTKKRLYASAGIIDKSDLNFNYINKSIVNSCLYKMLNQGIVKKDTRSGVTPYWLLSQECSNDKSEQKNDHIKMAPSKIQHHPTEFSSDHNVDNAVRKVIEVLENHGALYIDEIEKIFGVNIRIRTVLPRWYQKFIFDNAEDLLLPTKWTEEDAIQAVQKASTYYFPLTAVRYQELIEIGEIFGPGIQRIYKQFGWPEICQKAGVENKPAPRKEYIKTWSDDELLRYFIRFLQSEIESSSYRDYQKWANSQIDQVPHPQNMANNFGSWLLLRNAALEKLRIDKGKEIRT